MSDFEFQVWQDGIMVAGGNGPSRQEVVREAKHYVSQYAQDGPVKVVIGPAPLPASEEPHV